MADLRAGTKIGGKYKVLQKLGFGDAGTVYRVKQLGIDVDRAMKVLDPKLPGVTLRTFTTEFAAERQKLSQLTHRNLVKLIDADELTADGRRLPYYITDLVHPREGEQRALTLDKWAKEVKTRGEFVDVLLQLTDGLSYLHCHRCLHCDIKPKNLLLEPLSRHDYELKIADLGSSKILLPGAVRDSQRTHVVGTVDYAPSYVLDIINTNKTITLSQLLEYFPHWDLFCLGATLARIVWNHPTKGDRDFKRMLDDPRESIKRAFGKDFDVFKRIILRLVDPLRENCFPSAASVADAFRKFLPEYLVPLGVREMAVGGAHRALTQPRGKVYLSDRAYEIVEHPVFQRLHSLNQLNFAYMLYCGAKHSRFLHSLSTYEMAKRYIEGLLGESYFKYLMYKQDFELFLAAALLHDIGQYPLAHAIEDLGDERFTGTRLGVKTDYQMFEYFLKRQGEEGRPSIALLLKRKWGMDVDRLVRILSRGPLTTETDYFIRSMLDGPVDVDKVSYLLDDSYFTGARYGLGIDLDGFLSSLVAIAPNDKRHSQVGILDTGVVAAEGVIAARYSMFSRVYWHHFNRAIMAMLKYAAARVFLSPRPVCSFDGYINDTFRFSDLDAVRYLHDRLGKVVRLKHSNPLRGILDGSRTVHRRFLTFSGRPGSNTGAIYRLLVRYNFADLERLRVSVLKTLGTMLERKLEDYDVLFDVPKSEKRRDTLDDLYVGDAEDCGGEPKHLTDLSGVTKALCEEFEDHTKKCRIFISAGLREILEGDERKARAARDAVEGELAQIAAIQGR